MRQCYLIIKSLFVVLFCITQGLGADVREPSADLLDPKKGIFDLHLVHTQCARPYHEPMHSNIDLNLRYLNQGLLLQDIEAAFKNRCGSNLLLSYRFGLIFAMNLSSKTINFGGQTLSPQTIYAFARTYDSKVDYIDFAAEQTIFLNTNFLTIDHTLTSYNPHAVEAPLYDQHSSNVIIFGQNKIKDEEAKLQLLQKFADYMSDEKTRDYRAERIPEFWSYLKNPESYKQDLEAKGVIFTYVSQFLKPKVQR